MKKKILASAGRILGAVFAAYALVCCVVWWKQDVLLYFPEREYVALPERAGLAHEDVRLVEKDGAVATGWFLPREGARRTILYFHGNGGNVSNDVFTFGAMHEAGFAVLGVDYRGYGHSQGRPSERGLYRDADAAWEWLTKTKGLAPADIVVWGHSLGGGVASECAEAHHPGALVMDSTFTSVPDVGADVYWFLPVHLLASSVFPSLSRMPRIASPVLVAHSHTDEVIPYAMGKALFAAARAPKRFVELRGGHNDGLDSTPGALAEIAAFVTSTSGAAAGTAAGALR